MFFLHGDIDDLGDIAKFAKFANAFFTSSIVPDDIRILLIFHFCCTLATANMLSIVSDSLDIP